MQQSTMNISQANLSPPVFLQRTSTSAFSVIYTYCRKSSTIEVTIKYVDQSPDIFFTNNEITLKKLIELMSEKLNEYQMESKTKSTTMTYLDVDALRGSLPLPLSVTEKMILVRPNSTDKLTVVAKENLNSTDENSQEQWFNTTHNEYETVECSICCDTLTVNEAYRILPCMYFYF